MDAYHHGTLRPSQVGAWSHIIPPASYDDCIIIWIDLVILMGWVYSPKFFCAFSENTDGCGEFPHTHVATNTGVRWLLQDPQDRSRSDPHPGQPRTNMLWSQRCRVGLNDNAKSLTTLSRHSSGSSSLYPEKLRTQGVRRRSMWGRVAGPVWRKSWGGESTQKSAWHPPPIKTLRTDPSARHSGHAALYWRKGAWSLGGKAPLRVHRGSRGINAPLLYLERFATGGGG